MAYLQSGVLIIYLELRYASKKAWQDNRFATEQIQAPRAVFRLRKQCQPRWATGYGVARQVMLCEHAAHRLNLTNSRRTGGSIRPEC